MYNVSDIASYIIDKCEKELHPVNRFTLHRILFVIQKYYYKVYDENIFESLPRWGRFIPMYPEVEHDYRFEGMELHWGCPKSEDFRLKELDKITIDNIVEENRDKPYWEIDKESLISENLSKTLFAKQEAVDFMSSKKCKTINNYKSQIKNLEDLLKFPIEHFSDGKKLEAIQAYKERAFELTSIRI